MKIALFSSKKFERDFLAQHPHLLQTAIGELDLHFIPEGLSKSTASLAASCDAVCLFVNDVADDDALRILSEHNVRSVLLRCAGFNNVNLRAAAAHGLTVQHVPAYSPHAVAEFAVALILTLVRRVHTARKRTREHNFSLEGLQGTEVAGKTVGVIGTGRVGHIFCRIMQAFGARVLAYDVFPSAEMQRAGVEYVPLGRLYSQSDIISLHCPLLPSTRHLVDAEAIATMKHGVTLINTSRGELVDIDALVAGLRAGVVASCGLDVVEGEAGLFFDDRSGDILDNDKIATLLLMPNVIVTPHMAFCTDTAMTNIWSTIVQNAVDFCQRDKKPDGMLRNEVCVSQMQ